MILAVPAGVAPSTRTVWMRSTRDRQTTQSIERWSPHHSPAAGVDAAAYLQSPVAWLVTNLVRTATHLSAADIASGPVRYDTSTDASRQ